MTKTPKQYTNNTELLEEIVKSQAQKRCTEKLGAILMRMCDGILSKHNYRNYSYLDDMKSSALIPAVQAVLKFDTTKNSSPFAYLTVCIERGIIQFLKKEKSHQRTRDKLLVHHGFSPSYAYQDEMQAELDEKLNQQREEGDDFNVINSDESDC